MQSPPNTAPSDKNVTSLITNPINGTSPPPSTNSSSSTSPPPAPPQSPPPAPPTSPPPQPQSPPPSVPKPETSPPPPAPVSSPPPSPPTSSPPPSPPPATADSQPPPPPPPADSQPPPVTSPPPPSTNAPPPSTNAPPPTVPNHMPPTSPTFSPPPPVSSGETHPLVPPSEKSSPFEKQGGGAPHSEKPPASSSGSKNESPPPSDAGVSDTVIVAGIAVAGVLVFAIILICLIYWRRKKKEGHYKDPMPGGRPPQGSDPYYKAGPKPMEHIIRVPSALDMMSNGNNSAVIGKALVPSPSTLGGFSKCQFTYEELATATSGFSQANILGQGGFGYVHKGVLADGTVVAVKSLKSGSGQGEREFQAEVEIISRVHHRHLVSLVGYCIADNQRMLVYEYVPNKTLDFHLHGKGHRVLDWGTRLKIALGSAKGLAYLHEDCHPKIIHRDIKAANILLEDNFEAKVADFGLAKLSSDNFTHVSTRVMGTFGYLAPEYASSGKLTDKSDVFSFGIVLLELITGKRPVDPSNMMEDCLVDWARPLLKRALEEGKYEELIGAPLAGNVVPSELHRLVACAAASTRHSARRRPKMSQIVRALDGDSSLEDLDNGAKTSQTAGFGSNGSSDSYDTGAYKADMMQFRKMVMSTQDFNSSDYEATSEYGLNPSSSSTSSSDSREFGHHQGGKR